MKEVTRVGIKKVAALLAVLCCMVCAASCQTAQPEIEPSSTTTETTAEITTTEKQTNAVPPIDIADVPFVLAEMDCYLEFDKDGLAMPELKALFEEEKAEYEENKEEIFRDGWLFKLEAAEYDINDDGDMDYVVKWPHYEINPGNAGSGGFFDVVYHSNGKFKRMHTDEEVLITHFNPVVLHTKTNGFHDIADACRPTLGPAWKYNGTHYAWEQSAVKEDMSIYRGFYGEEPFRLEDGKVRFAYHYEFGRDDNHPPFFIAGLFKTAQKNGIVKHERLWCCDENGNPKLFTDISQDWGRGDAFFFDEYGGGALPENRYIWSDEVKIIIYEP